MIAPANSHAKLVVLGMHSSNRIPSLDGFRAFAIAMVTIAHMFTRVRFLGSPGVDLFFVISGFLITHLLIKEQQRNGKISFSGFYLRRARRILPAYISFLCIAALLASWHLLVADRTTLIEAVTYTYSLVPHHASNGIGQVWSLCVEEHFYLLWPLCLALLGFRRSRYALVAVVLLSIPLRFFFLHHPVLDMDYSTPTRLDVIAVGCMAAYAWNSPRFWPLIQGTSRYRVLVTATGLWLLSHFVLSNSGKYSLCISHWFEAACFVLVMFHCILRPPAVLNCRPVVYLGLLSYSIYLGQFLLNVKQIHGHAIIALTAIFFYGLLSFNLIEAPVLNYFRERSSLRPRPIEQPALPS